MQNEPLGPRRALKAGENEKSSLANEAYERLRAAIIRGEVRPNERLVETELAEWLEISRTPLREGLARLAAEGLVVSSRRGWIVREHTPEEIREIYEVRAALESMAAYLAATRATDEQIQQIVDIHASDDELAHGPRKHLVEVNDTFHQAIVDASGNQRLKELVRQSREFYFNYRIASLYSEDEALASLRGHEAIVEALRKRDAAAAEQAMERHIFEACSVTLAKIR